MDVPASLEAFERSWREASSRERSLDLYRRGKVSFVPNLLPQDAVAWSGEEFLELLKGRFGRSVEHALGARATAADIWPGSVDPALAGPVAVESDGRWIERANVVGVNVRTIGSFFDVAKYTLTLPIQQNAIHLLPIWEPGVVQSLYGICSWEINEEFFSAEWQALCPQLDTPERQLKALVNLLHLMGRAVGMDVIPHTDRYSEMALCQPGHFEWLRRDDDEIVDHRAELHEEVERAIFDFVQDMGPADAQACPGSCVELFDPSRSEEQRRRLIFGAREDYRGREARRIELVKRLHASGYEPVPATMAPPYRGLEVDPSPTARTTDEHGMVWRDYRIKRPEEMSRVFGPLARYKLYERLDDNLHWQVDFSRPREHVWRYVCERYGAVQQRFGFDYMRGDMSHVQMRAAGVPREVDEHYDLLMAVKRHVQRELGAWHFAYFAESFLAEPGVMGYGDECDHLEASEAEVTLGNLQSFALSSSEFLGEFRRYLDIASTRSFTPCFTLITADKDDPRFDAFYREGSALRLFIALFLPDLPSYMGLGFCVRDRHEQPAPNEHYSKLYVFQQREGKNATHGPFVWGRNGALFAQATRLRLAAERLAGELEGMRARWLMPPDPESRVFAWALERDGVACWLAVASVADSTLDEVRVPSLVPAGQAEPQLEFELSTEGDAPDERPDFEGMQHRIAHVLPFEGRLYRVCGV